MEWKGIPAVLADHIEKEAALRGHMVVDIRPTGKNTPCIEIVLDNGKGLTLDECADFNRDIVSWIDRNGIFNGSYTLDVCSPGLDRELKRDRDLLWAEGRAVLVTTREPIDKKNEFIGKLVKFDEDIIELLCKNDEAVRIEREKTARVRLYVPPVGK